MAVAKASAAVSMKRLERFWKMVYERYPCPHCGGVQLTRHLLMPYTAGVWDLKNTPYEGHHHYWLAFECQHCTAVVTIDDRVCAPDSRRRPRPTPITGRMRLGRA